MLVRHSPELLQGTLAPLLRAPRFLDFDNKRAFFRACVRASRAQAERRSQPIYVRREQVFSRLMLLIRTQNSCSSRFC